MNLGVSLGEFIAFMTVFVIPAIVIIYIANRFFRASGKEARDRSDECR